MKVAKVAMFFFVGTLPGKMVRDSAVATATSLSPPFRQILRRRKMIIIFSGYVGYLGHLG